MTPPVFAHGHLRLYLLSLLAESDDGMHGYELIQALGERFGGTYSPSAGTIYPRLSKLEEEGLVTKESDGRRTIYRITDAGRAELAARAEDLEQVENDVTDSVRRLADEVRSSVNDAMRSLKAELAAAAREARTESRSAAKEARFEESDAKGRSRQELHRAESAITAFRADLKAELRQQAAKGELSASAIDALVEGLEILRRDLVGSFGRSE